MLHYLHMSQGTSVAVGDCEPLVLLWVGLIRWLPLGEVRSRLDDPVRAERVVGDEDFRRPLVGDGGLAGVGDSDWFFTGWLGSAWAGWPGA